MDNQSKLINTIKETMHRAFWDSISDDLSVFPIKHKHVIILLDEISDMLKNLIPNRKDIHADIDEHIDSKFIEQMIVNNSFGYKELKNLIVYTIELIQKLQSPSEDKDTRELLDKLLNMCNKKEPWNKIILLFLKKTYEKIERIQKSVEYFKDMIAKKS